MGSLQQWFIAFLIFVGLGVSGIDAQTRQTARRAAGQVQPDSAEQLFALGNEARAQSGVGRLQWDPALAAAAMKHCLLMTAEGPISHRYAGEPDLTTRAGEAGAHFSLIEENIATGPDPFTIQQEWLHSPGHRANMLSRDVDHVGVAVVESRGVLYAVTDFSRAVAVLTPAQAEASVAGLMRVSGIAIRRDSRDARAACATDRGIPASVDGGQPQFVMRWQNSDLSQLPPDLVSRLASGRYRQASVGSCPARGVEGAFTTYRIAVLLY